jgi:hypothetical protein
LVPQQRGRDRARGVPVAVHRELGELADHGVLVLAGQLPAGRAGRVVDPGAGHQVGGEQVRREQVALPGDDRRVQARPAGEAQRLARAHPEQRARTADPGLEIQLDGAVPGSGQHEQVVRQAARHRPLLGEPGLGQRARADTRPRGGGWWRGGRRGTLAECEHRG